MLNIFKYSLLQSHYRSNYQFGLKYAKKNFHQSRFLATYQEFSTRKQKAKNRGPTDIIKSFFFSPENEKENKNSSSSAKLSEIKRLMSLYAPEKKPLAISLGALFSSTAITMCVPAGMGKVIDIVTSADGSSHLMEITGLLTGLFLFGAGSNILRVHYMNMIGERIGSRLRQDTYKSILDQELAFHDQTRTGELVNRLSSDTALIGKILSDNVASGLRSSGQALASVSMLFYTCPSLASMMLAIVPPLALSSVSYGRYVKRLTIEVQSLSSNATELAEEKISNIRTVRWFNRENAEKQKHQQVIDKILDLAQKRSLASGTFFGFVDLSVKMSMLAVLGYGGQMVLDGVLTVGELTSFLLYTIYVGFSFAGMSSFYSELMKGIGASARVFELMERPPQIRLPRQELDIDQIKGLIEFKNVNFWYPSRVQNQVFRNLTLTVYPGETLALVGPSGCGKSTITALLGRFYELNENSGSIFIDGVDISTISLSNLREIFGVVSQEPPLFAGSIRENICYGNEKATEENIYDASKEANAHEFIMKFPDGYDTHVGERGLNLSGGQKQRIAIARALIRNPKILILDEATSALDRESENLVQEAIERIKKNRTVLLVSHRLSTIRNADRIAVVSDGKIVEEGTFDELSNQKNSLFYKVVFK